MQLPHIHDEPIQCGIFTVYTNGSGEIIIRHRSGGIRISPHSQGAFVTDSYATVRITNERGLTGMLF